MQMGGNTILITGGGSGIGRGLADAFHALGNQVIIAGRRQQVLEEVTAANPGIQSAVCNIENADAIRSFAAQLTKDYPSLDAVILNDPNAMPLDEFIAETMKILKNSPHVTEICVERVHPLRFAERSGNYDTFFKRFNDSVAAASH
jgi:short-subunit dehydrogenase involved in D-alanine esterification of teichoic acids